MRSNLATLAVSLTLFGFCSALPAEDAGLYNSLLKRVVVISPDNTCGTLFNGANSNYSCDATVNAGGCCSQYGYVRTTSQPDLDLRHNFLSNRFF